MILRTRVAARSLLLQACWNEQGMQNVGFAFALQPWLRAIERRGGPPAGEAIARHLEYFNTQPYMASFVLGVAGRLEEERASAPEAARAEAAQRISKLKAAFGSALAGIGDALFWGALRPACVALAIFTWLVLWSEGVEHPAGWAAGLFLAAYNGPALWLRWRGLALGYGLGEGLAVELKRFRWQSRMRAVRWLGLLLAVLLTAAALVVPPWARVASWWNVALVAAAVAVARLGWSTPRVYAASVALCIAAACFL